MSKIKAALLKKRFALFLAAMLLLSVATLDILVYEERTNQLLSVSTVYGRERLELKAQNICFYDMTREELLYEREADAKVAPASTAKLLTALTAADYCSMEDEVRIGGEIKLINEHASRAWLSEGECLNVRQLITAMLLPSGNDAAYSLACFCGRKIADNEKLSVKKALKTFVREMNNKAESIGMKDSCFKNPDGFDKTRQYSTAYDLLLLAEAFCRNEELLQIVGVYESREIWADGREAVFYNTNELLNCEGPYYQKNIIGLKTGTSGDAGCCLISVGYLHDDLCIAVVMRAPDDESRFLDSIELFSFYENY